MPRPKRTEFAVEVDDRDPISFDPDWTPEHLILAALARCSLASLSHHAKRDGIAVESSARANGSVSEREDGSWGFVELECEIEATLELSPRDLDDLIARAERGCFVGSSLVPQPRYRWTVT